VEDSANQSLTRQTKIMGVFQQFLLCRVSAPLKAARDGAKLKSRVESSCSVQHQPSATKAHELQHRRSMGVKPAV
jgi:hypothetical protein